MNKEKLNKAVDVCKTETKDALQLIYNSLNSGQQKKLLKNTSVKELLLRFGVIAEGGE